MQRRSFLRHAVLVLAVRALAGVIQAAEMRPIPGIDLLGPLPPGH